MKKIYLSLFLVFSGFLALQAQLVPANVKIIDDRHQLPVIDYSNPAKRGIGAPVKCDVDTVEYPYYKSSSLVTVTISRGRSLGQLYSCPKPLVLSGFSFYAFVAATPPSSKKMNIICNVYKAGADSLPRGRPVRSDTLLIDSTFAGGVISKFMKRATFAPITLDSNFILTVETDSATLNAGIVTNNYSNRDGKGENLNCGSISGLWYKGRNLNVGGTPFNCDILLHPYVKYSLGSDFTIKNNCFNLNDSVRFINNAPSTMAGSRMYNRYLIYGLDYICHLWDDGNMFGSTYEVDHKVLYNARQNYDVRLISTVYGYRGVSFGCSDTTVKTLLFKPENPALKGLTNLCAGDTARLTATSNDFGVVFEWLKKPNGLPIYTGNTYEKFPMTKDDTIYMRSNNNGCLSNLRTIILKVNQYPKNFTVKSDSVCAGSKANLRASSDIGTVTWYTQATGGTPVYSGKVYQTSVLSSDTVFYAQAGNNGCNISPRLEVRALVGDDFAPQEPVISPDTVICLSSGGIITLKAVANSGLTVRWYDVSSGGSSINTGSTFSFQPTKREVKTFYVDAFNGICGSTREAVNVTIEDHPVLTGIYTDTVCKGDSTYVGFNLPFGEAYWYDDASAGNMFFVGDRFAALPDTTTNYYIQTASDICVSPSRTMITALVNTFPAVTKLWGDTICSKNRATLTCRYSGPGEVNWYESDTASQILGSGNKFITPVIEGGKRYFAQTNYAGCYGPKMAVQPTVKATPFSGFSFEVLTWQQLRVSPINAPNTTIRWDFGDGFTSTANKVTHRYEQPGSYDVKLVLTSTLTGCKDSTTVTIVIETSAVDKLNKLPAASLYPVPAGLVLNVKSSILGSGKHQADIYSTTGARVLSVEAEARDGIMIIPVASIAPGIYVLQVEGLAAQVFTKE